MEMSVATVGRQAGMVNVILVNSITSVSVPTDLSATDIPVSMLDTIAVTVIVVKIKGQMYPITETVRTLVFETEI